MEEKRYDVFSISCGAEELVAENMLIEDACILVKALLEEYHEQPDLVLQIRHRKNGAAPGRAGKAGG